MTYTYRIDKNDNFAVYIEDNNKNVAMYQPFNPGLEGFTPWASEAEAKAWAETATDLYNNPVAPKTPEELEAERLTNDQGA